MQKVTLNVRDYINQPRIDWVAMVKEIRKRISENNRIRSHEEFRDLYPRIGESVIKSAEKLVTLFRKKFEKRQTAGLGKIRFTYSYFKQHCNSTYVIRTFINHFDSLSNCYQKIFKKQRDVLKHTDGGVNACNAICIEFAPGIVKYENPIHNELHDMTIDKITIQPIVNTPSLSYTPNSQVFNSPDNKRGGTQKIGDLFSSLF